MIKYFEKQEAGKHPLTQGQIDSLSVKKTYLGKTLKVGDRLLFAILHKETIAKDNRQINEFIQLTEDEMDNYELMYFNENDRLPFLKLKNI